METAQNPGRYCVPTQSGAYGRNGIAMAWMRRP
jgi:hypothetical protein